MYERESGCAGPEATPESAMPNAENVSRYTGAITVFLC